MISVAKADESRHSSTRMLLIVVKSKSRRLWTTIVKSMKSGAYAGFAVLMSVYYIQCCGSVSRDISPHSPRIVLLSECGPPLPPFVNGDRPLYHYLHLQAPSSGPRYNKEGRHDAPSSTLDQGKHLPQKCDYECLFTVIFACSALSNQVPFVRVAQRGTAATKHYRLASASAAPTTRCNNTQPLSWSYQAMTLICQSCCYGLPIFTIWVLEA